MTKEAETAPQKLKTEAETMTAVVELTIRMMEPMERDKMNCAKKTMLLTMPTSVPMPRTSLSSSFFSSSL